ncbi:MAG: penicillin-binding protein [Geobacter sp.]|nr:penicillin-binding protein [Geobacter sp.]
MRDFKHISGKSGFSFFRKKESANNYRKLIETPQKQRRLKIILPALAALLVAYPLGSLLFSTRNAVSSVKKGQPERIRPYSDLQSGESFQLAVAALQNARLTGERLQAPIPDGGTLTFSIDPELQQRVLSVMEKQKVPYGVFVAVEPKTGRILAMVSHSSVDPSWEPRSFSSIYPMASLFKIVTASAALEQKKITPDTVFPFRGSYCSENPRYWSVNPRGRNNQLNLSMAMGKSVNPVYGRLASDVVGRDAMMAYVDKFGFNRLLFPNPPVVPSTAPAPQNDTELKLMGAGLGREVKISPVHAAAIISAVANEGVMMNPLLADEIRNGKGKTVFISNPQPLCKVLETETTRQLMKMLSTTVKSGTSRRVFHDRRGRAKLASLQIAAKTGSINGKDPEGHYSWFAAYAPADDPQIALVALVINQAKWKIKASYLGEQALEAYFR